MQLAARLRGEAIEVQSNLPLEEQFDYASLVEASNKGYKRKNSISSSFSLAFVVSICDSQ